MEDRGADFLGGLDLALPHFSTLFSCVRCVISLYYTHRFPFVFVFFSVVLRCFALLRVPFAVDMMHC